MFPTYFQLGLTHITDLNGYDHILFLIALCAAYRFSDWKRILILVTAFTLGHSLTLALAVMHIIPVNGAWVEFLIPLTILLTAVKNIGQSFVKGEREASTVVTYLLAAGFGLIHGMGFSNFLRSMLGDELLLPLFAFNVGLEVGQLAIVAVIFGVQWAVMRLLPVHLKGWNIALSVLAAGVSVMLLVERVPW